MILRKKNIVCVVLVCFGWIFSSNGGLPIETSFATGSIGFSIGTSLSFINRKYCPWNTNITITYICIYVYIYIYIRYLMPGLGNPWKLTKTGLATPARPRPAWNSCSLSAVPWRPRWHLCRAPLGERLLDHLRKVNGFDADDDVRVTVLLGGDERNMTCLFFHILETIILTDVYMFQRVWNHQPAVDFLNNSKFGQNDFDLEWFGTLFHWIYNYKGWLVCIECLFFVLRFTWTTTG